MTFSRLFTTAIVALGRNVLRSLLTMLGIVIGVAAVIAMMEIGQGAASAVSASISSMGSNILNIRPASTTIAGISSGSGSQITLTSEDADAILAGCSSVRAATPLLSRRGIQAVAGNKNWQPFSVYAGNTDYFEARDWTTPALGNLFSDRDVQVAATVCVIGKTIHTELFADQDPVGAEIRLNNVLFRVAGVLTPKGANLMGMDQDDIIVIPWTTMNNRLSRSGTSATGSAGTSGSASSGVNSLSGFYPDSSTSLYPSRDENQAANYPMPVRFNNVEALMVSIVSADRVPGAITEISEILRRRHRLDDTKEDDFSIMDMSEMLKTLTKTSDLMTNLLLIVAMISLVVGGVGIMNIMLVSVTERTREIGLRMAVGARGSVIMTQFLVEAVLLCLLGGCIGIALGRGISTVISSVLGWPIAVSIPAIIVSGGVSALIGIVFGFYPAWRASRLDPIEALRHE